VTRGTNRARGLLTAARLWLGDRRSRIPGGQTDSSHGPHTLQSARGRAACHVTGAVWRGGACPHLRRPCECCWHCRVGPGSWSERLLCVGLSAPVTPMAPCEHKRARKQPRCVAHGANRASATRRPAATLVAAAPAAPRGRALGSGTPRPGTLCPPPFSVSRADQLTFSQPRSCKKSPAPEPHLDSPLALKSCWCWAYELLEERSMGITTTVLPRGAPCWDVHPFKPSSGLTTA
jgi:hypothetical protein